MEKVITNPVKVILKKCLDCCCGQVEAVKHCPAEKCPLWAFRFGKNPYRAKMTEEQRAEVRERFMNNVLRKNQE